MAVTMCANLFMGFLNVGLMVGLVFGALIVLRPVTSRLLTPEQRVVLWGAGWVMAITPQLVSPLNRLPIPFLLLFLYTMPRASRSDREAAWNQYISSGELRREVERRIPVMYRDDMVELWTKGPGELIARGSSGRWYICHLRWSEEEGYQFGSVGLFYPEEGQLEAYSRVS